MLGAHAAPAERLFCECQQLAATCRGVPPLRSIALVGAPCFRSNAANSVFAPATALWRAEPPITSGLPHPPGAPTVVLPSAIALPLRQFGAACASDRSLRRGLHRFRAAAQPPPSHPHVLRCARGWSRPPRQHRLPRSLRRTPVGQRRLGGHRLWPCGEALGQDESRQLWGSRHGPFDRAVAQSHRQRRAVEQPFERA